MEAWSGTEKIVPIQSSDRSQQRQRRRLNINEPNAVRRLDRRIVGYVKKKEDEALTSLPLSSAFPVDRSCHFGANVPIINI